MSEDSVKVCLRCIVSGEVQGVFYRAATQQKARGLGVSGWARNRPDGTVEVLACGDDIAVRALAAWLWQGSAQSSVVAVTAEKVTHQSLSSFETG